MEKIFINFTLILVFILATIDFGHSSIKKTEQYFLSQFENKNELMVLELVKSKKYYSAVPFLIKRLEKRVPLSKTLKKLTRIVVKKTGTYEFMNLSNDLLKYHNTPTTGLILGLKLKKSGQNEAAISELLKIHTNHFFYSESNMILGTLYNELKKYKKSIQANNKCRLSALKKEKKAKHHKIKRYYSVLKESCLIHIARIKYKLGKFDESIKAHELVIKTSYKWPYILLEKAWTNYQLKNYNRALGLLVTYKSPLLSSYFFPESELLSALSYFKLCLWDDSLKVIRQYYEVYKTKSDQLKKVLGQTDSQNNKFLNLILNPTNETPYIKNLSTQIRKEVKFSVQLAHYKKEKQEYSYFKNLKKQSPFSKMIVKYLHDSITDKKVRINYFAKKTITDFINKVHHFSYEMFNLKLEIMSHKRNLLYKNKQLIAKSSRGSLDHVSRKITQHFWTYKGEFWADELGDYSFGLKSNCKKVNQVVSYKSHKKLDRE